MKTVKSIEHKFELLDIRYSTFDKDGTVFIEISIPSENKNYHCTLTPDEARLRGLELIRMADAAERG